MAAKNSYKRSKKQYTSLSGKLRQVNNILLSVGIHGLRWITYLLYHL